MKTMKNLMWKILLSYVVLALGLGCAPTVDVVEDSNVEDALHRVEVEDVNVTNNDEAVVVEVTGNLPSSAYSFDRFDINVDMENNSIEITPLAKSNGDGPVAQTPPSTQALVAFEEVCRIESLKPGIYELRVIGLNNSGQTVTVEVS